ncbi:hypothetical protein LUZ60_016900 [Juncus effusus]|nr:hypothetical protein LUZ60_016900 [Juncus effusus]
MAEMEYRDWASISPDLILLVLKNPPDIGDFIRFHAVCTAWRSAALHSPLPTPFLPLLFDRCSKKCCIHLHSPFAGNSHSFHYQLSKKRVSGPSHGELLTYDQKTFRFCLFNPVTHKEMNLPPLQRDSCPESSFHLELIENRGIVVVSAADGRNLHIWSCRIGDETWSQIKLHVRTEGAGNAHFKGMYYVNISLNGPTAVIDPSSRNIRSMIPPPKDRIFHHEDWKNNKATDYLVVSDGKLLRIFRFYDLLDSVENCRFEIHRLDFGGKEGFNWVKTGDLGDQMLFLDKLHGISKSCEGIKGVRGNCIYFTKYRYFEDIGWSAVLCRFDVGKGEAEALPCFLESTGSWVVPSLV